MIFLGHILSAHGISANPEKVDKVTDWLVPKNVKELHSFLGLASYYHWFIPNFAHMCASINWSNKCQKSKNKKEKVKKKVTTLENLDLTKPIFV